MAKSKWPLVQERFNDIARWSREGHLEKYMYTTIGVSKTSWEGYKTKYPELSELLKANKGYADDEVVDALYKNATGYYYYTDEVRKVKDKDGNESLDVATLRKWSPGSVAAQAIWLKNRCKDRWMDNPHATQLKREEFEHKKAMEERNNF